MNLSDVYHLVVTFIISLAPRWLVTWIGSVMGERRGHGNPITFTYEGGTYPQFILTMDDNWNLRDQHNIDVLKRYLIAYLNNQTDKDILCGTGSCNINNLKHSS